MSEEEKKAIEYLKDLKNLEINYYANTFVTGKVFLEDSEKEKIDKVLNLIEKQNKVIDFVTKEINSLFVEENGEIIFLKSAEEIKKHYFEKVEEENE